MYTSCDECGAELHQDPYNNNTWVDTDAGSPECLDENGMQIAGQKHVPDLCLDGTPEHNWIGPEFGEQICPECGSTRIVLQTQTVAGLLPTQAGGPVPNNPYAPSNPAIIEKFKQLQEKREAEMEARKQRTYRESAGDLFAGIKFEGGVDPDPGQCYVCPINFSNSTSSESEAKELLTYHLQQVHLIGVPEDNDEDEDDDATV